jgi:hypothetical protein
MIPPRMIIPPGADAELDAILAANTLESWQELLLVYKEANHPSWEEIARMIYNGHWRDLPLLRHSLDKDRDTRLQKGTA